MAFRIGLTPDQFWSLTPKEFRLAIEAFKQKEETTEWRMAVLMSTLTAPHLKKPIKPKAFIRGNQPVQFQSADQFNEHMRTQKQRADLKALLEDE